MLTVLKDPSHPLALLIKDDPVRPHIDTAKRFQNGEVWMLLNEQDDVGAVLCVSWQDFVPESEQQLFACQGPQATVAVFYSVWSLSPGAGQRIIVEAQKRLKTAYPHIQRAVTLSPHTAMARKFHLRNGAVELQVNPTTVNFEYKVC